MLNRYLFTYYQYIYEYEINYFLFYRFRILPKCKNRTCSESNTIYDTLSLPPSANNANNNTSISNIYSSLNINDFQSSYDNGRLDGSQNIHLSSISLAKENNTENYRNYENTDQRSTEYANRFEKQ